MSQSKACHKLKAIKERFSLLIVLSYSCGTHEMCLMQKSFPLGVS